MPSKALLQPMHALAGAERVAGAREALHADPPVVDARAVLARRDAFTSDWHDDRQVAWLEGAHIVLVREHGRPAGQRRAEVTAAEGTVTLSARHAVALATGSKPALPPVPGLAGARPWTTKDAASTKEVPRRLVVLGGGVAGCELTQVRQPGQPGRSRGDGRPAAPELLAGSRAAAGGCNARAWRQRSHRRHRGPGQPGR